MGKEQKINVYKPRDFTARHMPSRQLDYLLKGDMDTFFIVKVEEMYSLVKGAVPASRSVIHSCIFITEGQARMKIGTGQYTIDAGEVLFVPAGQVFSFEDKDVNKGYLCSFHDDFLIAKTGNNELLQDFDFMKVWGNPKILPEKTQKVFIENLMRRMLDSYGQHGLNHAGLLQAYLVALLCELNIACVPVVPLANGNVRIANTFRELVFIHIKTTHLVADYAAMLNISPNHLNKVVKTATGKSPTRWIDEAVVQEAKVLMSQSNLSINEIAREVGVEDQSYFTRLFKRYEGITPSAYRNVNF
jgi:AraC family transcriptional activator of pobA